MKMICAMLLAGAFLISRPVMAGDDAPAKTEKPAKAKKEKKAKTDKAADDKAAPAPAPAAGDKKAEKGGW
ncbi:MAG TPA: hypothetical protein VH560_05210 [Polyangia bacterium]|nr:hypothetical protein [Polyangia bacterium]